MTPSDEINLTARFAELRGDTPKMDPDVLARLVEQASAEQTRQQQIKNSTVVTRPNWLAFLADLLPGWPAATALAACVCAGFWLGYVAPGDVGDLVGLPSPDTGFAEQSYLSDLGLNEIFTEI